MSSQKIYRETTAKPDFPSIESEILLFWNNNDIFNKSITKNEGHPDFVFYDGPPFANGLPHYGHVLQSYIKDSVARYQTMNGNRVLRRWGWDCHGLPPELKTEKELGISGKKAIEAYGIDKFTDKCRADVLTYANEWSGIINRLGRWVDMKNAYKTMDLEYQESVMWAFKELYDKGLAYEDFRILPYSWCAETPLSNFEVNQGYKEKTSTTATVLFSLENGMNALVWTTTPWTLPSNLMLAVGENIEYSVYEKEGLKVLLATTRVAAYKKELEGWEKIETIKGSDLVGLSYTPLFPYFSDYADKYNAFKVLAGDFVSDTDGTGIVHIAPGFGEDDFAICKAHSVNFPILCPVDDNGKFTELVDDLKGRQVFETNDEILSKLKIQSRLFKKDQLIHQYPFCWRTDQPLIYKAMSSWFIRVSDIKEDIIKSNEGITWIPSHIKHGRFGKWLEGARDWSISRNRFWGAPIPVWKSDNPKFPRVDVFGSIAEIEKASGHKITDLHRPYIDEVTYKNPDDASGQSMMRRVSDVFDCWFESGSMPYASCHYPFENKDWFENNFPADFITEATDQTRGWFYTLVVLGTALFGKSPFKTCVCSGFVFDEKKQKLSKKLGNYSEPSEFFNKYGSDSFRWFLLSSPLLRGENASVSKSGDEVAKSARNAIIPFYNAYHFFTLYANADGIKASIDYTSEDIMDRYILNKLDALKQKSKHQIDNYDIAGFCEGVEKFLDTLNNWYIRLSRERFWGTSVNKEIQLLAFNTLYTVLVDLSKLTAPFLPFTTDYIYKNLTEELSVHLSAFPLSTNIVDDDLIESMDMSASVCSTSKSIREEVGLGTRQPLQTITIASPRAKILERYKDIIKGEANVKEVILSTDFDTYGDKILYVITPVVGKRLGAKLSDITIAAKAGNYKIISGVCHIADEELTSDEFEIRVGVKGNQGKATSDQAAIVILDTILTPELKIEGIIRDFIRAVQEERKSRNFNVSDRIEIIINANADIKEGVEKFSDNISSTTLATKIEFADKTQYCKVIEGDLTFDIKKV